jgi:hypothetical protein
MVPIIIKRVLFIVVIASFALVSCQTAPPAEDPSSETEPEVVQEPVPEAEAVAEPEAQVVAEPEAEPEEFVVTEEVFEQTFQKVEEVILELNRLIRAKDFEGWLEYLNDEYIGTYSDPALLAQYSESDRLKSNGIVLTDLEDFFTYVVVPSRANLRLDDLVFLSEDQVEAIMIIRDQRVSVYKLRLIDNEWKIEG